MVDHELKNSNTRREFTREPHVKIVSFNIGRHHTDTMVNSDKIWFMFLHTLLVRILVSGADTGFLWGGIYGSENFRKIIVTRRYVEYLGILGTGFFHIPTTRKH